MTDPVGELPPRLQALCLARIYIGMAKSALKESSYPELIGTVYRIRQVEFTVEKTLRLKLRASVTSVAKPDAPALNLVSDDEELIP